MDKKEMYAVMLRELESLVAGEDNAVGVLANAAALIYHSTGYFWVGFYMVRDGMLRLGPFQGPVACYRIGFGKGVCGTAWERASAVIVPNVEKFPGHIACSSLSRSEIVVPLFNGPEVAGVLDIDSKDVGAFDETDRDALQKACAILSAAIF